MDKSTLVWLLVEAVIFLLPIASLFIKLGGYKKMVEKLDDYPEWKASINTKITQLELNDIAQNKTLESINNNLVSISTKVSLLLENKIKLDAK